MARTFNVDLDLLYSLDTQDRLGTQLPGRTRLPGRARSNRSAAAAGPMLELARVYGKSDRLLMHKHDAFRITGVVRLHPKPVDFVNPADPEYPFVRNVAGDARTGPGGRFRKKTPDLKQDNGIKFRGNIYMLDWDPSPPFARPGLHFKVFP